MMDVLVIDVLAPLGLVAMALFVVAIVMAARKQQRARAGLFEELAKKRGWRYLPQDDGTAQALARGFEDFARFRYASGEPRIPSSVVLGRVEEGRVCLFSHGTSKGDGDARLWCVCIIEADEEFLPSEKRRIPARLFEYAVEAQVRERRLAVYLAGRNDEVKSVRDLEGLLDIGREMAQNLTEKPL